MNKEFYLTLPSNSSMLYYPSNTTTKFSTHLSQQVTLKGTWQVALVEFHYPSTFQNITEGGNILYIYTHGKEEDVHDIHASTLTPGVYDSPEKLVALLNHNPSVSKFYQFKYDKGSGYCRIDSSTQLSQHITNVEFPDSLSLQLGMEPESKLPKIVRPCNFKLGLPSELYVYCDIIEPQLIGDTMAPLLRIVSVNKSSYMFGDQKTVLFQQPHYVQVLVNQFDSIEVDIRLDSGRPAPFQFGTSLVKLHFRRVGNEST